MPVSSASRRSLFLLFKCVLCECALCLGLSLSWLQSSSWAQETPAKPAAKEAASPKPKLQTAPAKIPDTRPSEPYSSCGAGCLPGFCDDRVVYLILRSSVDEEE